MVNRTNINPRSKIDGFLRRRLGWMPARIALAIISWFGFVNLYMVRVNLSIAIVAMVKRNATAGREVACDSATVESDSIFQFNNSHALELTEIPGEATPVPDSQNEEGELLWDDTTQGLVLGSFSYGYALTQVLGGRMAELYGARMVYGVCILAGGISAILSPVMARWHYGALIALRIIQGMFQGVSWPCMHACITRWIPPIERPRFVAIVYLAATLSSAITMPLCGVIIDNHGWASQFYVMGALSLLWCCVWFNFMYNSPEEHPRISVGELQYIRTALKESGTKKSTSRRVPWREIFSSVPVWAIFAGCTGNGWGISLLFAQLPTYMKNVLGFSIRNNGTLSAAPFLCRYLGGIFWSSLSSWLVSRNYLSITNSRRIFGVLALWGPGAMILGVSFAGCDATAAIILLCLALFCNGANTTSILVNHTDVAPNFAGTLLGLDNTLGSIIAFIVPIVTGIMTEGQKSMEAWQRVFWVCVPIYFVTAVLYLFSVSGEVQPWNDVDLVKTSPSSSSSSASKRQKPQDVESTILEEEKTPMKNSE
ncbi:putative inorganic phosphate cotransporter [Macrobrachium rosenbergii]|uniref:putative inorganic phosphate cotransporter n=1 Tax=Macrobrachium rosenbergii TaxID=79674 RepID=UPI0034D7291D